MAIRTLGLVELVAGQYHVCPSGSRKHRSLTKDGSAVCGDCTACFDDPRSTGLYPIHGNLVKRAHVAKDGAKGALMTVNRADHGQLVTVTVTTNSTGKQSSTTLDMRPVPLGSKGLLPGTTTGLLSKPSKMRIRVRNRLAQVWALNLTAAFSPAANLRTCPLADFAKACGGCYARQGRYAFRSVALALECRTVWISYHLEHNFEYLVNVLVELIGRRAKATRRFRLHDAGDFFSALYVRLWVEVARRLPWVQFWAPCRPGDDDHPVMVALQDRPTNLVVRPSGRAVAGLDAPSDVAVPASYNR